MHKSARPGGGLFFAHFGLQFQGGRAETPTGEVHMVVMQLPDGTTGEYRLRSTPRGLRLERSCASYDLLTLICEAGWVIREVKTDIARTRLRLDPNVG